MLVCEEPICRPCIYVPSPSEPKSSIYVRQLPVCTMPVSVRVLEQYAYIMFSMFKMLNKRTTRQYTHSVFMAYIIHYC